MSRYDDFENNEYILLQENSSNNSYQFLFPPADSETGKGSIPYDTQISSVNVSGYFEDGTDYSAQMIQTVNLFPREGVIDKVVVDLSYPGINGRFKLTFLLTLTDGSVWEKDFNRIEAIEL